ncbi:hypothetical protein GVAV_000599 [Gurleya vavrai]
MKIIILYEDESCKILNFDVFIKLKFKHDTLEEFFYSQNKIIDPLSIYIYVYRLNILKLMFSLQITENNTKNDVQDAFNEIIYTIYNFKKLTVNGIVVKDKKGNKIKPIIDVFYYNKPGLKLQNKLIHLKKHDYLNYNVNLNNLSILCQTDDEIISDLLKYQNLYFTDELNDVYALIYSDTKFYICPIKKPAIRTENYNSLSYLCNDIENSNIHKLFLKFSKVNYINNLKNAFLNTEQNVEIHEKFLSFLKKLQGNKIDLTCENLLFILNALPNFFDHRKKYIEKLIDIYKKILSKEETKILFKCDYLHIKQSNVVDKNPMGSLKRFFNKKQ